MATDGFCIFNTGLSCLTSHYQNHYSARCVFHKHTIFLRAVWHCILVIPYFYCMFNSLFNWRTVLAVIAIAIVTGTVFYSNYLAKKIAFEEKIKIEQWADASKDVANSGVNTELNLAIRILTENSKDIQGLSPLPSPLHAIISVCPAY